MLQAIRMNRMISKNCLSRNATTIKFIAVILMFLERSYSPDVLYGWGAIIFEYVRQAGFPDIVVFIC